MKISMKAFRVTVRMTQPKLNPSTVMIQENFKFKQTKGEQFRVNEKARSWMNLNGSEWPVARGLRECVEIAWYSTLE